MKAKSMHPLPIPLGKAIIAAALFLFLATAKSALAGLRLVEDGQARAVIVLAAEPGNAAEQGARILGDHLFQISGARLEILPENKVAADDGRVRILIGASEAATRLGATSEKLGPGGILIRTYADAKALVLLGADRLTPADPNGTRYAVTTFLENALGVRFLWPGEAGKVVPKRRTIDIEDLDRHFTPLLVQRRIRMAGGWGDRMTQGGERLGIDGEAYKTFREAASATETTDAGWAGWHRLGGTLRLAGGHSFGDYWERFGESHPEWFAMAPNGSRDQSASVHRARLCVSNQALIEQVARDRIARIEKTGQKSVSIGPNDGGTTSFCICDECKKLDPPEGRKITLIDFSPGANRRPFEYVSLTDRYVHFFNGVAERVAEKHPDVWLTADAYSVYAAPPVKTKLHPNIAIRFVGVTYTNEERRRQGIADWHAWADSASKIFFRSNLLLAGRRQGTPVVYAHKLAEDFGGLAKDKMIGTDLDSCCHHWATQGLNYYVMARLLWNPDLDIDALIDDYCRAGFGAGAEAVKRYFLAVEKLTDRMAADTETNYTTLFTPETVAELRAILDEAARATADDPATGRRVAFLRLGLDYTDAYSAIFRLDREWQASGGGRLTPEMRDRFRSACDRNWKISREIVEEDHFAVNTTYVAWGSWAYFGRFGWKPAPLRE